MIKYLFTALFIFMQFILLAQDVPMEFRHHDKASGLDQPFPYSIIQDNSGFIWIGGENGLWRYSGSEYKHYHHIISDPNSLVYDFVWKLFEDSKGNIWACTYGGGLSKYNPKLDQFSNYAHITGDSNSLSDNKVRGIVEDSDGNIWIGTNEGLDKLNPETGKFQHFGLQDGLADLTVRTIKLSKDNSQLFIATGNGVNILDLQTEKFKTIGKENDSIPGLRYTYIYDLLEYDGQLWVGTGGGLELIDLRSFKVRHISSNPENGEGLSHNVCFSIYKSPKNSDIIWFGTMNGINYYNKKKERFFWVEAHQKDVDNIGGNSIYNVFEDNLGGVWAAVNNGGVYQSHPSFNKFKYHNFLPANTDKYLNRYTSYIQHSNDELLITSYSGLIVWNQKDNSHQIFKMKNGDQGSVNRMSQITRYNENEYLISVWGNFIYHWDHHKRKLTKLRNDSGDSNLNFNLRIYVDHNKTIWLGNSLKGLYQYDLEKQKLNPYFVSDLSNLENSGDEYIKYITEDNNKRLWVGTADGLHLLKDGVFEKFSPSRKKGDLSNGNINHIANSSKNGLWISTELGLNFFSFTTNTFTSYYKKDGLPSNVISGALEDDNGNLWVATASGLAKMNDEKQFSIYDGSDGLREEYFIFGSAFKSEDNHLYFGTSREIVHFNPDELEYNKMPPKPYFDQLSINNSVVNMASRPDLLNSTLSESSLLSFQPTDLLLNFNFDALNLINGQKNKYSLKMEGLDTEWRSPSLKKNVSFSNLPAGDYKLRLIAVNDENIWSKEEASLAITILPYWYESWWFRTILAFSLILIIGLIIQWRFNIIKSTNRKLEGLVKNRTEEVLAQKEEIESQNDKLLSRNNRIELLLRELNHRIKNNLQLVSSILNLHSRSTDNIDAKMALTEGKLRMQALSLLHQKLYMTEKYTEVNCKDYIKELLDYLSIAFKSNYSNVEFILDIDDFKLNLDQAVPLGLILNELVTNSLKHSGKEELKIELLAKTDADKIMINLKDNGDGITQEQFEQSSSFGISMIKSLVDQIDGRLSVGCKDGPHFKLEFISKEND